jgi:hypothetical protein
MTVAWSGLAFSQTLKQQIYLNETAAQEEYARTMKKRPSR